MFIVYCFFYLIICDQDTERHKIYVIAKMKPFFKQCNLIKNIKLQGFVSSFLPQGH